MTIFPDDDKKRKKDYPEPEPNPPHAFQGGTIRGADGIRIDVVDGQIKLDGKTVGRYKRPAGGFNRGCGIIFIIVVVAATALVAVLPTALALGLATRRVTQEAEAELARSLAEAARLVEQYHGARLETAKERASLVADLPKLKAAVEAYAKSFA